MCQPDGRVDGTTLVLIHFGIKAASQIDSDSGGPVAGAVLCHRPVAPSGRRVRTIHQPTDFSYHIDKINTTSSTQHACD